MAYDVTVVDLPARQLVGLRERVNLADASVKCPALWERFMPMCIEISDATEEYAYGASTSMAENGEFDYWATLPVLSTVNIPVGMEHLTLRAGKYAKCVVELASIEKAYKFFYGEWARTRTEHPVDFTATSFERYAIDWQETGTLELYVPLS
ncbi:MAG: GyrI-like domain-containing protein [Betaproteobacteria bacterium]|nr:GyrI-like domain-containing protein [Betaproteobacteria bacterium]